MKNRGITTTEILILVVMILFASLGVLFVIKSGGIDISQANCFNSKLSEMPSYCLLFFK